MMRFGFVRTGSLVLGSLAFAGLASAQTKVSIIDLQKAVLECDEIKKASKELEAKYRPRQERAIALQKELETIQQQLQTGGDKMSQLAAADLQAQGQRKQRELQHIGEDLQADVDRERNEILARSTGKMRDVVKKLAEEKGLDVVVEANYAFYFKPALEITLDAIAAYNKANPVAK